MSKLFINYKINKKIKKRYETHCYTFDIEKVSILFFINFVKLLMLFITTSFVFTLHEVFLHLKKKKCFRSLCSLVCKWTYIAGVNDLKGWQDDFFTSIGLDDLVKENYEKIGKLFFNNFLKIIYFNYNIYNACIYFF